MSEKLEKPAVSYETVCKWFDIAAINTAKAGRQESATLWRDGLEHLKYWHNLAMRNPKNKNQAKAVIQTIKQLVKGAA